MIDGTMSLRPAQALVAESSRFSLRTFFEAKAQAEGGGMHAPGGAIPLHGAPGGGKASLASTPSASEASDQEAQDEGCRVGAVDVVSGDRGRRCSSQTLDLG